jgi:hypothetical protein
MTSLEAALVEVASLLEELSLPYMLIGGLAVAIWGEPRATLDADFSIWVEEKDLGRAIERIIGRLRALPPDPLSFAREQRVLPVKVTNGIRADLVFATLPGEKKAIARAVLKEVGGKIIKVASIEDLIWMKLISERPKDLEDARRLVRRFAASIDRDYLEPLLRELSEAFARGDILEIYRREIGQTKSHQQ